VSCPKNTVATGSIAFISTQRLHLHSSCNSSRLMLYVGSRGLERVLRKGVSSILSSQLIELKTKRWLNGTIIAFLAFQFDQQMEGRRLRRPLACITVDRHRRLIRTGHAATLYTHMPVASTAHGCGRQRLPAFFRIPPA
jgi:hypothetical protein